MACFFTQSVLLFLRVLKSFVLPTNQHLCCDLWKILIRYYVLLLSQGCGFVLAVPVALLSNVSSIGLGYYFSFLFFGLCFASALIFGSVSLTCCPLKQNYFMNSSILVFPSLVLNVIDNVFPLVLRSTREEYRGNNNNK